MTKFIFLFYILLIPNLLNAQQNIFDILDGEIIDNTNWTDSEQEESETPDIDKNYSSDIATINDEINEEKDFRFVNIRVQNKITTHNFNIDLPLGLSYIYDGLELLAKSCYQSENPVSDSKALIKIISDEKPFNGWIFANDPALNVFEHPKYNLTLVRCK